jgi:aspartokinase
MQEIDPKGFDFLGDVEHVVLKVGGENASDVLGTIATVKAILATGRRVTPVFSAPRGIPDPYYPKPYNTTDQLVELGDHVLGRGTEKRTLFEWGLIGGRVPDQEKILEEHRKTLDGICSVMSRLMGQSMEDKIDRAQKNALWVVVERALKARQQAFLPFLEEAVKMPTHWIGAHAIRHGRDRVYQANDQQFVSFTGFGELASADVYAALLQEMGVNTSTVDTQRLAPRAFYREERPPQAVENRASVLGAPVQAMDYLLKEGGRRDPGHVICVPGYASGVAYSKGYSDVLAMICARAIGGKTAVGVAKQWPIWSRDPKGGEGQLVPEVSRDFGINLFEDNGGKAAALHPDAMDWLTQKFDAFVFNPAKLDRGVTRVTAKPLESRPSRVDVVALTPIPAAVTVKGGGMADRPDVFNTILDQFGGISIGHAPSDAQTVFVSFHDAAALERIDVLRKALAEKGDFSIAPLENLSWVHCLGNHLDGRTKGQVQICLADAEIEAEWSVGSPNGIKLLVVGEKKANDAVDALHAGLISSY